MIVQVGSLMAMMYSGGTTHCHVWVGHDDELWQEVADFLEMTAEASNDA